MNVETESTSHEWQKQKEHTAAVLTLAAFQNTPWERRLRRAAEQAPQEALEVFKATAGLYWAYANDLPQAENFEEPTKAFLTRLLHERDGFPPNDGPSQLEIAGHIQEFVHMWAAIQSPETVSRNTLPNLISTLQSDAARRLDTIEYPTAFANQLSTIVRSWQGAHEPTQENPLVYNALTRHFTNSPDSPPVLVHSVHTKAALNRMRATYTRIITLAGYKGTPEGQQIMWEIIGVDGRSRPSPSLRELLLGADLQTADAVHQAASVELDALADPALNEPLRRRNLQSRLSGRVAVAATTKANRKTNNKKAEARPDDELFEETQTEVDLWELVEIIKKGGDEAKEAYGKLYAETYRSVYRFIYFRVKSKVIAEDLTSSVYLRAIKSIHNLENHGHNVQAWFMTIARNVTIDHVKSAYSRLEVITDDMSSTASTAEKGHGEYSAWRSPEAAAIRQTTESRIREIIMDAITKMPSPKQQKCVYYRFIEELSVSETAERLLLNEGAVKTLQFRALNTLRSIIRNAYPHLADKLNRDDL